ncbi:hypothetical protein Tco_0866300 [Tanacetum coccineum]
MIGCEMMRTLANVEFESILILGLPCCLSSSRCLPQCLLTQRLPPRLTELRALELPAPFLEDPYEAIRHACLVETDTESEPFEDPVETETPESPHTVASPTPLPDSTPPACHAKELEDSDTSGARSTSSDSTAPLSPDHPLTRTSPTPTPTRASFYRRTARMTVRAQPVMSPSHSARVTEAMALSDSTSVRDTDSEEDEIREECWELKGLYKFILLERLSAAIKD